jgi:hypothetical protein
MCNSDVLTDENIELLKVKKDSAGKLYDNTPDGILLIDEIPDHYLFYKLTVGEPKKKKCIGAKLGARIVDHSKPATGFIIDMHPKGRYIDVIWHGGTEERIHNHNQKDCLKVRDMPETNITFDNNGKDFISRCGDFKILFSQECPGKYWPLVRDKTIISAFVKITKKPVQLDAAKAIINGYGSEG